MRTLILSACILLGTISQAQSKIGLSAFFAPGKGGSTIAQTKIDDLRFKRFSLDVDLFTGTTWKANEPSVGGLLGKRWTPDVDGKLEVYVGVGIGVFGSTEFHFDLKSFRPGAAIGLTYWLH